MASNLIGGQPNSDGFQPQAMDKVATLSQRKGTLRWAAQGTKGVDVRTDGRSLSKETRIAHGSCSKLEPTSNGLHPEKG